MKRLSAALVSTTLVVVLGCTRSYESRLAMTLKQIEYQQRLDQFLNPPEDDPFKARGVYVRLPKPLSRADRPDLAVAEGAYDLLGWFVDLTAVASKKGGAPSPSIRAYVLGRVKQTRKAQTKKGAPPPPEVPRGEFVPEVRSLLASHFGLPEFEEAKLEPHKAGKNEFRRMIVDLQPGSENRDVVTTYFYNQGNHDVAFVWLVPDAAKKSLPATTGINLCLESFAVGNLALRRFAGDTDDTLGGEEGPVENTGGGQAF